MDGRAHTWKSLVKAGKGWSRTRNPDLATVASSLKVVKPHGDFPYDNISHRWALPGSLIIPTLPGSLKPTTSSSLRRPSARGRRTQRCPTGSRAGGSCCSAWSASCGRCSPGTRCQPSALPASLPGSASWPPAAGKGCCAPRRAEMAGTARTQPGPGRSTSSWMTTSITRA